MHRSTVETVLEYEVKAPTHFCFSIEAAHCPTQNILSERLAVSSGVAVHSFTDPGSGNRFFRFDASPGPLLVNYAAEVEVHSEYIDECLPETPLGEVPDEIFHYLMPTRFCESDVMGPIAQELFGHHSVPRAERPRAAGGGLRVVRRATAGFSRDLRGLDWRALGVVRRHGHGAGGPSVFVAGVTTIQLADQRGPDKGAA